MKKDFLVIICPNMELVKEFLERTAQSLLGCEIITYPNIPFIVVKSSVKRIEDLKTYIFLISILEKEFINNIVWLERSDLIERHNV
jgi:hypothetical protein